MKKLVVIDSGETVNFGDRITTHLGAVVQFRGIVDSKTIKIIPFGAIVALDWPLDDFTNLAIDEDDATEFSWRAMMPLLIIALQEGTDKGKAMATEELYRLADFADKVNGK